MMTTKLKLVTCLKTNHLFFGVQDVLLFEFP